MCGFNISALLTQIFVLEGDFWILGSHVGAVLSNFEIYATASFRYNVNCSCIAKLYTFHMRQVINPVKQVRWSFLRKKLTVFSRYLLSQKA